MEERLYTSSEAAAALGLSFGKVYKINAAIRQGKIPVIKKEWHKPIDFPAWWVNYVRLEDVKAWWEQRS